MWHEGLLYKLQLLDCPEYILVILKHYLANRKIKIRINKDFSDYFRTEKGLPQGSPLSPLLFNIYCHDIYNHAYADKNIFDFQSYILQFADDTALIAHGTSRQDCQQKLKQLTDRTLTWLYKWRLKTNSDKSQFICFYDRHPVDNIQVGQHMVSPQPSSKYLGIQIDKNLNFKSHLKTIKQKTVNRAKQLRKLTFRQLGLSRKHATLTYKVLCRPLLDYGAILFTTCSPNTLKIISTAETTALRTITRLRHPQNILWNPSNQSLYDMTKTEPILRRQRTLNQTFLKKTHNQHLLRQFLVPLPQQSLLSTPKEPLARTFAALLQ